MIFIFRKCYSCSKQPIHGEAVLGKDAGFGGHAEEDSHGLNTLFVEDVVDVGGEVGTDGRLGNGDAVGPLCDEGLDVL